MRDEIRFCSVGARLARIRIVAKTRGAWHASENAQSSSGKQVEMETRHEELLRIFLPTIFLPYFERGGMVGGFPEIATAMGPAKVRLLGLEPRTYGLKVRCSTN